MGFHFLRGGFVGGRGTIGLGGGAVGFRLIGDGGGAPGPRLGVTRSGGGDVFMVATVLGYEYS